LDKDSSGVSYLEAIDGDFMFYSPGLGSYVIIETYKSGVEFDDKSVDLLILDAYEMLLLSAEEFMTNHEDIIIPIAAMRRFQKRVKFLKKGFQP
jgi:hypothetical protein